QVASHPVVSGKPAGPSGCTSRLLRLEGHLERALFAFPDLERDFHLHLDTSLPRHYSLPRRAENFKRRELRGQAKKDVPDIVFFTQTRQKSRMSFYFRPYSLP